MAATFLTTFGAYFWHQKNFATFWAIAKNGKLDKIGLLLISTTGHAGLTDCFLRDFSKDTWVGKM